MSYRQTRPLVPFFSPKASQLSDFGRPRASSCNDTPYESEITTARLKLKSQFDDKWLRGGTPADEPLVGIGDIEYLADLGNSFQILYRHEGGAVRQGHTCDWP